MQLQQEKQISKTDLLRKCGLLAHTSAAFLKNCCTEKLFICLRFIIDKPLFLEKPPESGSARLGHIPSLPWKSQLPLKPYLSLQPSDFEGNCDSSDFLLDFRCSFSYSFYLLCKCGLLAHTSAAFLKNCCTEKLFICLRLVLAKIMAFFTTFTQFSLTPISRNVIILMFIERTNFDEPSNKIAIFNRRNFYEKRF